MNLIINYKVPKNRVYMFTGNRTLTVPERKPVEVKVFDNVPKLQFNIRAWEKVGYSVYNGSEIVVEFTTPIIHMDLKSLKGGSKWRSGE